MPLTLHPFDIALRVSLSILAGSIVGLNRGERGRPAGIRTMSLVCLAACLAMLEANALLATTGRARDSFVTFDVMRLPLGILTGVGFIGGGAILRRDTLVIGLTTAATLWFVTVAGLCFGAGLIGLGLIGLSVAIVVLWAFQWIEDRTKRERRATLTVRVAPDGPADEAVLDLLAAARFQVKTAGVSYLNPGPQRELKYEMRWRGRMDEDRSFSFLRDLAQRHGLLHVRWED